jgi:hypothetical protein
LLVDLDAGARPYEIGARLERFYRCVAQEDIPELTTLATTVEQWWPEIPAFLQLRITNARTEGYILWSLREGVPDVADGGLIARQRHFLCMSSSTSSTSPRPGSMNTGSPIIFAARAEKTTQQTPRQDGRPASTRQRFAARSWVPGCLL